MLKLTYFNAGYIIQRDYAFIGERRVKRNISGKSVVTGRIYHHSLANCYILQGMRPRTHQCNVGQGHVTLRTKICKFKIRQLGITVNQQIFGASKRVSRASDTGSIHRHTAERGICF